VEPKLELVKIWIHKSTRDLESAKILTSEDPPYFDTAIYHCQQAAEKALKGFLIFCEQEFEKIHDIEKLISLASMHLKEFSSLLSDGKILTPYATKFRYPDDLIEPDNDEYRFAYLSAKKIYDFVISKLPGEVRP
jgi:HEPN domain-containing protein